MTKSGENGLLWLTIALVWVLVSGFAILWVTGCAAPSQAWYQNQALQASIDNASNQAALETPPSIASDDDSPSPWVPHGCPTSHV